MKATLPYIGTQVPTNGTNKLVRNILGSAPVKQVIQLISLDIVFQEI